MQDVLLRTMFIPETKAHSNFLLASFASFFNQELSDALHSNAEEASGAPSSVPFGMGQLYGATAARQQALRTLQVCFVMYLVICQAVLSLDCCTFHQTVIVQSAAKNTNWWTCAGLLLHYAEHAGSWLTHSADTCQQAEKHLCTCAGRQDEDINGRGPALPSPAA